MLSTERKSTRDGDLDILEYQDAACKVLASEPNPIIRELYAAKVADKLGVPSEAVVREIERRRKNAEQVAGQETLRDRLAQRQGGEIQETAAPFPEDPLFLLCLIASSPDLVDRMRISPEPEDFPEGVIRDMAVVVLSRDERAGAGLSGLIGLAEDADWHGRRIADEVARMSFEIDAMGDPSAVEEAANSYLSRVRKDRLVARKAAIVAWIAAGGEGADKVEMKEELLDIDVQLRQFRG
jgi:hypothetical protein